MGERPILFSAPMVRAILDGRKSQTRRVVKHQPNGSEIVVGRFHPTVIRRGEEEPGAEIFGAYSLDGEWGLKCPYGEPGDKLWVREAHSLRHGWTVDQPGNAAWYWADGNPEHGDWTKPRPSIHMPRWACRIVLEVTEVRVQRLQDINEADCIAEGCEHPGVPIEPTFMPALYRRVWETINGPGSLT